MAANNDAYLINNDNSYKFFFRCVSPFKNKKSQPVVSLPLVNTTAANNVLFRFFGQDEEVSFSFAIFNDDTDVADGTYTSTVKTVAEQIVYLRDQVFSEDFDVDWEFNQDTFHNAGITVVITNLEFDKPAGAMTVVTGNITLKRGRIGSL